MVLVRKISISSLGFVVLSSLLSGGFMAARASEPETGSPGAGTLQDLPGDPVLKARAERAAAQGIGEGDLPPLPKGVVEPPPLPPPETHVKDTRRGKLAKSRRNSRSSKAKRSGKHPSTGHGHSSAKKSTKHKKKGKA